jgi:hypothetical protein
LAFPVQTTKLEDLRRGAAVKGPAFHGFTTGSKILGWLENSSHGSGCLKIQCFDSVTESPEFPDHSRSPSSLSLFADCGAAFFIVNAVVQNDPDQLTEAMCNGSDGFVVSEA